MRISILIIVLVGFLSISDTYAQPGANSRSAHPAECSTLREPGVTRGLYGLCVAYCVDRDQSNVDPNDTNSVRAAAPDIALMRAYNSKKTASDPAMPCTQHDDDGGGSDGGGSDGGGSDGGGSDGGGSDGGGSDGGGSTAQCPCWSSAQIGSIDGNLDGDLATYADCTTNSNANGVYRSEIVEGYDFFGVKTLEGAAWTQVDNGGPDPYNGCYISTSSGFSENQPAELADAEQCMLDIANQCAIVDGS